MSGQAGCGEDEINKINALWGNDDVEGVTAVGACVFGCPVWPLVYHNFVHGGLVAICKVDATSIQSDSLDAHVRPNGTTFEVEYVIVGVRGLDEDISGVAGGTNDADATPIILIHIHQKVE